MKNFIQNLKKATTTIILMTATFGVQAQDYATSYSSDMNGKCAGCMIQDAEQALGSDFTKAAVIKTSVSKKDSYIYQSFGFSNEGLKGSTVTMIVGGSYWDLVYTAWLGGLNIQTYNDGALTSQTVMAWDLTLNAFGGKSDMYELSFTATEEYDEVRMVLNGGIASTLHLLNVYGLYHSSSSLPVSWLYVNAHSEDNNVAIQWATATEINNDFFSVEMSLDGTNFETIDEVKGAGNSSTTSTYKSIVPAANMTRYFRIRQNDFNGKNTYSQTIAVAPANSISNMNVFQSAGVLNIRFEQEADSQVSVVVSDINGRIISNTTMNAYNGSNSIVLQDVPVQAQAIYVVTLASAQGNQSQKFFAR
ncbi:MAG: T9SS type A sorting domain-containing protein [Flavobacteriales bacterium]|nr:T9SS type A sorting domain-containing protein [Flavobacteriales bacterium]MCB9449638.1 T9SS type A sorting domain-containing protein [Flavobacteriales bacterium]